MSRYLLIALLIGAALRVPGWFTADEKSRFKLFEPDESQHVDIALNRYRQISSDSLDHVYTEIFNARGYGIVSGHVARGWRQLSGQPPKFSDVILLNRQLSTLYALFLMAVVFGLCRHFGLSPPLAGLGATLLAVCDLNVTYAHYGIPAVGYVLGVYTLLLGAMRWRTDTKWYSYGLMTLGAALAFAFKFDFLPALLGGIYVALTPALRTPSPKAAAKRTGNWERVKRKAAIVTYPFLLFFFFLLITGFSWSWEEIRHAWTTLRAENENVIAVDQHWWENPVVYGAAIVGGIGFPAVVAASYGLFRLPRRQWRIKPDLWLLTGLVLLEFLVRWRLDTPFVRRANVFMPALCLAAAYGCSHVIKRKNGIRLVVGLLIYTLVFTLVGQSNHWFDTREAARGWINTHLPAGRTIVMTPYAAAKGVPDFPRLRPGEDWEYAVLHESYYHRYTRSLTTPFGFPDCCEEVYHCAGKVECESIQQMISGEDQSVELIALFPTRNWLPERFLYRLFFGTYETFLGDVRVYRKMNNLTPRFQSDLP